MLTVLVVVAVVLAAAGLAAGFLALVTLGRVRRAVAILGRGAHNGRESFLEASARHVAAAERTGADLETLRGEFETLRTSVLSELRGMRSERAGTASGPNQPDPAHSERAQLEQVLAAERAERGRHLDQVQLRVEDDFTAMRAELEQMHSALSDQTQAERARLAEDNSAAREQLRAAMDKVEKVISTALRRVALVRYDAFDDLGGRLSFSLAVLDSRGDGVALTSLAGREETRVYAKAITAGVGLTDLSPEERQAVDAALAG